MKLRIWRSEIKMKNKDYEGEYFVFGVNSPNARFCYGEDEMTDSCVVFRKEQGKLVPVGEESRIWMSGGDDSTPKIKDAVRYFRRKGIEKAFTADVPFDGLWGLVSAYAPKDWDYDEDPAPPAEVYFARRSFMGEGDGIEIEDLGDVLE